MNLPLTIAYRYLRRPSDKLVSAVGTVSILGLVIGVMALVISMALMAGYRRDLPRKLPGPQSFLATTVYATGFYEYDARWLLIDLRCAERPLYAPHGANLFHVQSNYRASLDAAIPAIGRRIHKLRYAVTVWSDHNHQL